MRFATGLALLVSLQFAAPAHAEGTGFPPVGFGGLLSPESMLSGGHGMPTPPAGGVASASGDSQGKFFGAILFQDIGEDKFLTLDLATELSIGPVKLGFQVPISLRIIDEEPKSDDILRMEDWDELADFARVIRFLELNLGGDDWGFRGRIGALEGESIGHGTALAGYYNTLDRDHYQGGLALRAGLGFGGVEFMLDNILAPEIFGSRVFVRPASFFSDSAWAKNLVLGFSYVADTSAPVSLEDGDTKNATFDAALDETGNYKVASRAQVGVMGVDLEYSILKNALIDLIPYVDGNLLMDQETGFGLHVGTFFNVKVPTGFGPKIMTRLEYRYVGENYVPRYIDSLYEAQRLMFSPSLGTAGPKTKLGWLRDGGGGTHGWLGELFFDFAGLVRVGGTYEDYEGPNNSALTLSLLLPEFETLQTGAYYSHRGFDTLEDAFNMDGALFLAFVRSQVWGPVYATAAYSRTWSIDDTGNYVSEDDWNFGLGLSMSY